MQSSSIMASYTVMTRSTLELMLEKIQTMEDEPKDVVHVDAPPALPARPVTRARLPRSRRQLAFNFQKSHCEENGNEDVTTSFHRSTFKRKKLLSVLCQQESANETIEGCNITDTAKKASYLDDRNEPLLEEILRIQEHCHVHQTCCNCHELKRGVIALQSFIRGENARKGYVKNMTAIAIIQKHAKEHLRSRVLCEQDQAVICLQTRIQGWLTWRHFASVDGKQKQLNQNTSNVKNIEKKDPDAKDQVQVPYSILIDLRRRVLKTEALLDKKKEENASLRLQIKQLEGKRQQYEAMMKSKEKLWQDQLTSMQITLAAAKKSSSSKNAKGKLGRLFALTETHDDDANDALLVCNAQVIGRLNSTGHFIDQQNEAWADNNSIFIQVEPGQVASTANPQVELQKLKLKFKAWSKDFKTRLMRAKTTIKKLGNSKTVKCQKRWCGR